MTTARYVCVCMMDGLRCVWSSAHSCCSTNHFFVFKKFYFISTAFSVFVCVCILNAPLQLIHFMLILDKVCCFVWLCVSVYTFNTLTNFTILNLLLWLKQCRSGFIKDSAAILITLLIIRSKLKFRLHGGTKWKVKLHFILRLTWICVAHLIQQLLKDHVSVPMCQHRPQMSHKPHPFFPK